MHRRYPLLVALSLFVLALTAWDCMMMMRYSSLPFVVKTSGPNAAQITPYAGTHLPPRFEASDRVVYARQTREARLDLLAMIELATIAPGHKTSLNVTHADGSHETLEARAQTLPSQTVTQVTRIFGLAWFVLIGLIALFTLWRGRDRVAWGIAIWAIAFESGMAFYLAPGHGWTILGFGLASQLCYLAARVGFFLMADAVVANAFTARARWGFRIAFLALIAIGYAYELSYSLLFVFGAILIPVVFSCIWVLPYALVTVMLLAGHRNIGEEMRPRLRWMGWSAVVLTFGILLSNVPLFGYLASYLTQILCYVIAFSGLLYSVLRHRVVDMSFVVNRAIVYSVTLGVIATIFVLLESFAESLALGKRESLVLEFGVPLVIGFSFEAIRKRLENFGERIFFRRKFENEKALRAFARQCAYIKSTEHLRDESMRELTLRTDTPAAAFYWHSAMKEYHKFAQTGNDIYPEILDIDDRAAVTLRAESRTTDLQDLASALGKEGLALPMMIRGELLGLVVIANRPGESFPADERALLGHVVHEVGNAMLGLRARANSLFINAIADGSFSEADIRTRARALLPPNTEGAD